MSQILLSEAEARVVAVLVEKSQTTPQYYPMTVNAITNGCNQKSCRFPLMQLSEVDVARALNSLEEAGFVDRDDTSGRTPKYRHQFKSQLLLKSGTQATLVTLMLRGPQTVAELQRNATGLNGPADAQAMQTALDDLADRGQPLVRQLPRAAGQKEARWVHLLCGEPDEALLSAAADSSTRRSAGSNSELEARLAALEARVATLEELLK